MQIKKQPWPDKKLDLVLFLDLGNEFSKTSSRHNSLGKYFSS